MDLSQVSSDKIGYHLITFNLGGDIHEYYRKPWDLLKLFSYIGGLANSIYCAAIFVSLVFVKKLFYGELLNKLFFFPSKKTRKSKEEDISKKDSEMKIVKTAKRDSKISGKAEENSKPIKLGSIVQSIHELFGAKFKLS